MPFWLQSEFTSAPQATTVILLNKVITEIKGRKYDSEIKHILKDASSLMFAFNVWH